MADSLKINYGSVLFDLGGTQSHVWVTTEVYYPSATITAWKAAVDSEFPHFIDFMVSGSPISFFLTFDKNGAVPSYGALAFQWAIPPDWGFFDLTTDAWHTVCVGIDPFVRVDSDKRCASVESPSDHIRVGLAPTSANDNYTASFYVGKIKIGTRPYASDYLNYDPATTAPGSAGTVSGTVVQDTAPSSPPALFTATAPPAPVLT